MSGGRGSLEPRPSSPRFYLADSPIFLQGCEIKSGRGRPGFEAGGGAADSGVAGVLPGVALTASPVSLSPSRVHSNLRVVVAVPQVGVAAPSGCGGWAELLNALRVCYHLPWDRKQLMDVAKYHLAGKGRGHVSISIPECMCCGT